MVKYQKILRVVLLTAMMSSTLPGAFASSGAGEGSGGFPVDPDRFALLSQPVKVRGTYQRHQLKSLELQYRIRDLEKGAAEDPSYRDHLIDLIYLKFKTVYDLGRGFVGKPLETTERSFIEKVESKYEGLSGREQGTIISPFKDMVELLHQIGIGPDLIAGLNDAGEGYLNSEFFLYKLMAALELPDPCFITQDLPKPYYRYAGERNYLSNDRSPETFLEAYAGMLDHIAHNFTVQLRNDVSSFSRLIASGAVINGDNELGAAERPENVFQRGGNPSFHIWKHDSGFNLSDIWDISKTSCHGDFQAILRLYDDRFPLLEESLLNAAIPPNPLGMAYRLLQATEKDIHSWPIPGDGTHEALAPTDNFLATVQRILSRHYNVLVLRAMAENVRKLIPRSKQTVASPVDSPLATGAGAGAAGFGSRDSDGGGSPSGKYPAAEELSEIQRHYLTMGGNYDASAGVFTNPNGTTEQIAPKAQ